MFVTLIMVKFAQVGWIFNISIALNEGFVSILHSWCTVYTKTSLIWFLGRLGRLEGFM